MAGYISPYLITKDLLTWYISPYSESGTHDSQNDCAPERANYLQNGAGKASPSQSSQVWSGEAAERPQAKGGFGNGWNGRRLVRRV